MTKSELIAALEQYPDDSEIVLIFDTCPHVFSKVYECRQYEHDASKYDNTPWNALGVVLPGDPQHADYTERRRE